MGVSALADHVGILQQFVSRFGEIRLFSTSAAVVTYPAPLYNVIGSTDDPKVPGYSSWTSLLQGKGCALVCSPALVRRLRAKPVFSSRVP